MKVEEYKGHSIEVRDGIFYASFEGMKIAEGEKLKDVKKSIDSIDRRKLRQPCLFQKWSGRLKEGTLTSVVEKTKSYVSGKRYEVWVGYKDEPDDSSSRVKVDLASVYPATALNKTKFNLIKSCVEQIEKLEDKIYSLKLEMVSFKSSDLGYKKEGEKS